MLDGEPDPCSQKETRLTRCHGDFQEKVNLQITHCSLSVMKKNYHIRLRRLSSPT